MKRPKNGVNIALDESTAPFVHPVNDPSLKSSKSVTCSGIHIVGLGVGLGVGAGVGLLVGAGVGLGVGRGVGLGVGRGVGPGVGRGVGPGVGPQS